MHTEMVFFDENGAEGHRIHLLHNVFRALPGSPRMAPPADPPAAHTPRPAFPSVSGRLQFRLTLSLAATNPAVKFGSLAIVALLLYVNRSLRGPI